MIPVRINQMLVLSTCAIFVACGTSSNERGIASSTSDATASGSAYNSNDGFAPAIKPIDVVAPAPAVATPVVADSVPATTVPTVATPASTPGSAAAAPVVAAKPAPVTDDTEDIKKGQVLISKSDCLACHKVDGKILGPSYKEVADKYANNNATVAQLADKIKKGGSGVWGPVPMSPHPTLSDDDAKAMVKYILSLK